MLLDTFRLPKCAVRLIRAYNIEIDHDLRSKKITLNYVIALNAFEVSSGCFHISVINRGHAVAKLVEKRSRVRFPIMSLELLIGIILRAALWP